MAEDAGAADLIAGGRLQLGISRGSPEQVIDGLPLLRLRAGRGLRPRRHGARAHPGLPRGARGRGLRRAQPAPDVPQPAGPAAHRAALARACATGSGGVPASAPPPSGRPQQGMNLMSSTLLTEDTGVPFHQLQAEQIQMFRDAWTAAGHEREPRVSVSRSIFPIVNDLDRAYFGRESRSQDQVGNIDGGTGPVRQDLRRRARPAGQGPRRGRGDRGRRHAAAHRAEPARRRLQRPRAGDRRAPGGPGARLALAHRPPAARPLPITAR